MIFGRLESGKVWSDSILGLERSRGASDISCPIHMRSFTGVLPYFFLYVPFCSILRMYLHSSLDPVLSYNPFIPACSTSTMTVPTVLWHSSDSHWESPPFYSSRLLLIPKIDYKLREYVWVLATCTPFWSSNVQVRLCGCSGAETSTFCSRESTSRRSALSSPGTMLRSSLGSPNQNALYPNDKPTMPQ